MKNREDTLYVKSNNGNDFWLFDLDCIKAAHHGFNKESDGKLQQFVEFPIGSTLARFYDKDYKFALYRKNTDLYYILSHFQLLTVIASPEGASDILRNVKTTCNPSDWSEIPKGLK